jgi:hypothetical protein
MSDLTAFLMARITADEVRAQQAESAGPWIATRHAEMPFIQADVYRDGYPDWEVAVDLRRSDAVHIADWNPVRVLAECDAKCRIIDEYLLHANALLEPITGSLLPIETATRVIWVTSLEWVLRTLAATYADHPDYREEWRP